ncbi:MAG TPA: AarF/ABC1/UbiB kinase family protein [Chromatiaceae bacterium]|nr:AarF/ABC1/UbiB kinase family protein [Chromatiaceae bacterium]
MKKRSRIDQTRENLRLQKVYNVILNFLMDILFDRGWIGSFRRFMQEWIYRPPVPLETVTLPVKFRLLLEDLGPTYVKMGQIVSSQSDVLPPDWAAEMVKLQNDVPPFPYADVVEIIQAELGAPPEEVFAEFDPEPLAAASTAQVHRAVLPDGATVAVKVQRPNIQKQVKADLGIMQSAARVFMRRLDWARNVDLASILDEFGTNILTELDYRNEAYNATRLNRAMEDIPNVKVPEIYYEFSTEKVLTMEFVQGVKVTNVAEMDTAGLNRLSLAEDAIRGMLKQLLMDGFFHADPHPGNVLVNLDTGTIYFIDTGMVGELDVQQRLSLINLIFTLQQQDARGLAQVALSLSNPFREVDEKAYYRDFERLIGRLMEMQASTAEVVSVTFDLLQQHGLRMDPQLTLAVKAFMQAERVAMALDPNMQFVNLAQKQVQELAVEQITPENVTNVVKKQAAFTLRELMREMPDLQTATLSWMKQYKKGRFEVFIDTSDLSNEVDQLNSIARQVIVGILLVGMLIGSAIAAGFAASLGDGTGMIPQLAYYGYLLAMGLAIIMIVYLLWKLMFGRKYRNGRR